ncbi:hypothetical protein YDYSY3_37180 [Paenibacillus chitinolyticus]|nr:hypothetical protein YDYSY3_37180 [Paenibacillus chitinolyticus]
MQLDPLQCGGQGDAHRTRPAAEVDNHRILPCKGCNLAYKKLGTLPGDEDSAIYRYPQTAKLRPADHVLKRETGRSPVHHSGKLG